MADFREDWKLLGYRAYRGRKRPELEPDLPKLEGWVSSIGQQDIRPAVILGPSQLQRAATYKHLSRVAWQQGVGCSVIDQRSWLQREPSDCLVDRVADWPLTDNVPHIARTVQSWGWLWALIYAEELLFEGFLHDLAVWPSPSPIHEVTRLLMRTRFEAQEGRADNNLLTSCVNYLSQWMLWPPPLLPHEIGLRVFVAHVRRVPDRPEQRLDVLLYLLSLAYANGFIEPQIFVFDGLGSASPDHRPILRDLRGLIHRLTTWSRNTETPVGLALGLSNTEIPSLRRCSPQFAKEVEGFLKNSV